MAGNTSIALGDHFRDFASGLVQEGRYGSVSEAVRAGLRLLEAHETQVSVLRQALDDGLNSGAPHPFDPDAFLQRMRAKTGEHE